MLRDDLNHPAPTCDITMLARRAMANHQKAADGGCKRTLAGFEPHGPA